MIGAGVTGLATAYQLARAGRSVAVLEQLAPAGSHGSSYGTSRIFRLAYPEREYIPLAQEALLEWNALERESREILVVATGTLDIGVFALQNAAALEAEGVRFEMLTDREATGRWPLSLDAGEELLYQPDGGILRADRCCETLLAGAVGRGATVETGARVVRVADRGESVAIDLEGDRRIEAGTAVVAAGSWARDLLSTAGIELQVEVTRETVAYFDVAGAEKLPAVLDDATPDSHFSTGRKWLLTYALPAPGAGLKAGLHHSGPAVHPSAVAEADPVVVEWVASWVRSRYAVTGREPVAVETCLYTSTDDARFVIERHGRIVVGSACSGHGFKFAPVVGRRLAELAQEAAG